MGHFSGPNLGLVGQLLSTATNDDAAAGKVGEYMSATGSNTSITTATSTNLTNATLSLTAGDWDVTGICEWDPAATTNLTLLISTISSTSATLGSLPDKRTQSLFGSGQVLGNANSHTHTLPTVRFSLTGATTIYLVVYAAFSVSTLAATGFLRARRMR